MDSSSPFSLFGTPPSQLMISDREALPSAQTAAEVVADITSVLDDGVVHPYQKLREELVPFDGEANYQQWLLQQMVNHLPHRWSQMSLPEELADPAEDIPQGDGQVPLTCVAFHALVPFPGTDVTMNTTWRKHSTSRVMAVVRNLFIGKRGLDTRDRPTLILHEVLLGSAVGKLPPLPHGIGSTRLMACHLAAAALMKLSTTKDYSHVREVQVAAFFCPPLLLPGARDRDAPHPPPGSTHPLPGSTLPGNTGVLQVDRPLERPLRDHELRDEVQGVHACQLGGNTCRPPLFFSQKLEVAVPSPRTDDPKFRKFETRTDINVFFGHGGQIS